MYWSILWAQAGWLSAAPDGLCSHQSRDTQHLVFCQGEHGGWLTAGETPRELVCRQAGEGIPQEVWSCVPDQAVAVVQASDAKKSEQAGNDIFGEPISPKDARPRSVMGGVRKPPGVAMMSGTQCDTHVPCCACGNKHAQPCQVLSWGIRGVRRCQFVSCSSA